MMMRRGETEKEIHKKIKISPKYTKKKFFSKRLKNKKKSSFCEEEN
jgi:hypothetical protein